MLRISGLMVGLSLLCTAPAGADEATDAKAVVEKAIKALGGADKLAKLPATTFKCKGTGEVKQKSDFSGTWSVQLPDKYRAELEITEGGNNETVTLVVNGDKAWAREANRNRTEEAPADAMSLVKADFGAVLLAHTLTPLTGKGYKLSALGEVKVNDKAAAGVKVERKDLPDLDLFFDKETHLPVKAEVRVKEPGGEEVLHAFFFSDYKETDGLKHFTKMTMHRADKETIVMELSEVKRLEKLDATLFDKP
jgi:outer membrane lipoprotein-sorting protein